MKACCGWLYTLSKYGYPPSINQILLGIKKASDWGFEAIEMGAIEEAQLTEMLAKKVQIKKAMDSCGIQLINFIPVLPGIASLEPCVREHALELFEKGVEIAAYFGAKLIHADSYEVPLFYEGETPDGDPIHYGKEYRGRIPLNFNWDQVWENLIYTMRRRVEISSQYDLPLGVELRLGETIGNTEAWLRLAEAVRHPNFGVIFDSAHLYAQKEILALSIEKLKDRIFFIHAADNDGLRNQHLAPGEGTIDWPAFFEGLKRNHFKGYVALDIGDTDNLEEAYPRAKKFIEAFL